MKLLLSAYACRPNMGSEPAVGWNWILELSKYYQLTVLTNFTNKPYIDSYIEQYGEISNTSFIYVRPNKKLTFWYKEWERFERLYYILWQKKALKIALKLNKATSFDAVQHLTYVTCVMPTYMYKLGIPFIYGPISGGEKIPAILKVPMNKKEKLVEIIRTLTLLIPKSSLNTQRAFKAASKIIVVTNDTKNLVPAKYRNKVEICQAISLNEAYFNERKKIKANSSTLKVLIAGRMLAWKGFDLGIDAVLRTLEQSIDIELTVLGTGNAGYMNNLKNKAGKYLNNKIFFVDKVKYDEMPHFYDNFDILLNCSLRDSGCLVVMEAMGRGLPIICVNTGGPAVNTDESCAIKVEPALYNDTVENLASALIKVKEDKKLRDSMALNSRLFAEKHFKSDVKIKNLLWLYDEAVK